MSHPRDQASTMQLEYREQILLLKLKWYFLQVVILTLQKIVLDMLFPILSKMGFFNFYYSLTDLFIYFVLWLVFYPSSYFCISRRKFENCSLVWELGFYLIVLKINKQIKIVLYTVLKSCACFSFIISFSWIFLLMFTYVTVKNMVMSIPIIIAAYIMSKKWFF